MKKIIITTMVVSLAAGSAFSQGFVSFGTGASAGNRISTNSAVGGAATGQTAATANGYYFALFASANQTSINGNTAALYGTSANYVFNNMGTGVPAGGWELVGIGASTASAGRQGAISQGSTSANQAALNSDLSLTVQGIAGGNSANFIAIGWSANIGSTLAAALAWYASPGLGGITTAWFGQSAIGVGSTLGDGNLVITPGAMGPAGTQFAGFTLGEITVPEPGTLALAALGGASLLLFRRKK